MNSLYRLLFLGAIVAADVVTDSADGSTFQVSATIVNSCKVSGTTLNFGGAIDPLANSGPLDTSSVLTVICTNTTPYTVSLNAGTNSGGASSFSSRAMKSGGHSLAYQLYTDGSRSTIWGDGSGGSSTVSGTGTGNAQALSIYGRVSSLANVVPGNYSDTVMVTITY